MRLFLHTIVCCCLLTMVLPLVKGAKEELNSSLKKRFKLWLQVHMKRDPHSSLVPAKDQFDGIHDETHQDENANIPSSPPSIEQHIRFRRSASSKKAGCLLGTCAYHDLIHGVFEYSKPKDATAPKEKMGSGGYGRRRRSLLEALQLALQTRTQRRSIEAGQQVRMDKSTRTVA
ncbi:ADM Adrenomedullin [Channa argus]|uniref:ADM Adrenomedullin n=1 Tax=Channa argus TaxID=215402 RepID=A0A6G1QTZ3_CHAAH|nr:ADM Adrenomedullin [Channa argus]KAK2880471.1 hypothetical protein Q8A73_023169 [Channa argus]